MQSIDVLRHQHIECCTSEEYMQATLVLVCGIINNKLILLYRIIIVYSNLYILFNGLFYLFAYSIFHSDIISGRIIICNVAIILLIGCRCFNYCLQLIMYLWQLNEDKIDDRLCDYHGIYRKPW